MDPSEFEDTIVRGNDVLKAGLLEEIFVSQKPKFCPLDLSPLSSDIYLKIYTVKESIGRWNEFSFESSKESWDEKALKVAELKEDYVGKKKALAAKVRSFNQSFLENSTLDTSDSSFATNIMSSAKDLISEFKNNFDNLANAIKFSESSFVGMYKQMRDMPDPIFALNDCLTTMVKCQDGLKSAQEQLAVASNLLESSNVHIQPSSTNLEQEMTKVSEKLSQERELSTRLQNEILDMRSRFDTELRSRDQALRDSFERRQLEQQQEWEGALATKETEMSSLLSTLNDLHQRHLEADERAKMLEFEITKRRDVEDRLRATLTQLAEAQTAHQELQTRADASMCRVQVLEGQMEREVRAQAEQMGVVQREVAAARARVAEMETELASRPPPIDLSALAARIGIVGEGDTFDISSGVDGFGAGGGVWPSIEAFVIDNIRRANAEAAESRVKEQDASKALAVACDERQALLFKQQQQEQVVQTLERDLMATQRALESTKAVLKCFQTTGAPPAPVSADNKSIAAQMLGWDDGGSQEGAPGTSSSGQAQGQGSGMGIARGERGHMYSTGKRVIATAQVQGQGQGQVGDGDDNGEGDVEKGSGGAGVALLLGGEGAADEDGGARVLQALQSQRDRYMRAAQEREQEVGTMRSRLERAQDEQLQLRGENLELYRRLRALRASARQGGAAAGDANGGGSGGSALTKSENGLARSRKFIGGGGVVDGEVDADALDMKYSRLHEEKVDPFRVTEELDRQGAMAKLNVFERALAYVSRFLLQDQWTRHALMIYLLFIHCLALGYMLRVLNPQLVDEVDQHMKEKWSAETLDMEGMHPDEREQMRFR